MDSRFSWSTDYRHPTAWDQEFAPLSLPDMLAASVARKGDAPMLDFLGRQFGYAEVANGVARVARGLQQRGIGKGSRVGLFLPNVPHYVAAYYGALAAGATVVNFSPLYTVAELEAQVEDSGTETLFTISAAALLPTALKVLDGSSLKQLVVGSVAGGLPPAKSILYRLFKRSEVAAMPADPRVIRFSALTDNDGKPDPVAIDAEKDIALIQYTGGTTGTPKGVLLTHRNLSANGASVSREHALGAGDRVLATLPLYHINGLVVTAIAPLVHGGSVVMPMRFSASAFWHEIARHGCTWLNVVPTIIAYLLNDPDGRAPAGVRFCRSASAALPPEHHRAFEQRFGIGVIETMGMTETAAPAFSNPFDPQQRRIGSIGRPSGTQARVLGRDGQPLPDGEIGEIVLQGENVMAGYYKAPEVTREAFTPDGWLRTGDLGYRDAEGYFYITGRAKELIIKGGENIAPREIDEALLRHPGVLEAAAVGVPDPAYGQEIVAFIVRREAVACDDAALRAHCLRELGRYKTPREFRFIAELPRGPSGKVQRLKLLDPA